jgi:hypothetical protein
VIVIAVRFTLRELLDRLEEIDPPDATTTASKPTGWRLTQPEPGVLVWHTPAGRSYTTTPTQYAI